MKACIRQIDSLMDYYSSEFLIKKIDETRIVIKYPYLDKVTYYNSLEKAIEVILENAYGIKGDIYEVSFDNDFAHDLCHYLIGIIGSLQDRVILWYIEKNELPSIVKDEFGNIERIETNEHIDYIQMFRILLFELKRECFRMEGYNLDDEKLLKLKK